MLRQFTSGGQAAVLRVPCSHAWVVGRSQKGGNGRRAWEAGWQGPRKGHRSVEVLVVRGQGRGTGEWYRSWRSLQLVQAKPASFGGGAWIWGQEMVPCHHWPLECLVRFPGWILFSEAWSQHLLFLLLLRFSVL